MKKADELTAYAVGFQDAVGWLLSNPKQLERLLVDLLRGDFMRGLIPVAMQAAESYGRIISIESSEERRDHLDRITALSL